MLRRAKTLLGVDPNTLLCFLPHFQRTTRGGGGQTHEIE